ncbi:MAG: butyrate kinase [Bacillota bacterium]
MSEIFRILVINPGATSTKIAIFENEECVLRESLDHPAEDLLEFPRAVDQYDYRMKVVTDFLAEKGYEVTDFSALVGRGGPTKPVPGGTFRINQQLADDVLYRPRSDHPSSVGSLIAFNLGKEHGIPAFIVDPVSVDEFEPVARVAALPNMERLSLWHALNSRAAAHKVARKYGKRNTDFNFVVVHLGSGISVSAHRKGSAIDVNMPNEEGPFSPERCGTLPSNQLIKMCFSGEYTEREMLDLAYRRGGVFAHLGTKDMRDVERMIEEGNEKAKLVFEAMAYNVAKEIGAMATVLKGKVDKIIITGGIAYSQRFVDLIVERVAFIAPVEVVPGEEEMEALAFGGLRVLRGEEEALEYE